MSGVACEASRAEVIRWHESEGHGAEVELASLDIAVLRYDGQGKLIVPARPEGLQDRRDKDAGATGHASMI